MSSSRKRIRIVHLVTSLGIGGLEKVVFDLARSSDQSKFDIHVLCLQEPGALAPQFAAAGIDVEGLLVQRKGRLGTLIELIRRLYRLRPDILHTHNQHPHFFGALAGVLVGIPYLVHTRHGRNWYPRGRRTLEASRLACRLSNRVVPVSLDASRCAREFERVPPRKIRVIRNGIDLSGYSAGYGSEEKRKRPPTAIHIARLNLIKDQTTLLKAARIVANAEPDFRLIIVGDGPDREELIRLSNRLGLSERAFFRGFREDVKTQLAAADLFVLSSLSEGISLTLLEAMAAGLPVVATDVGGNREVVADGQTGLLVPPSSPEALAKAILTLMADPEKSHRMGLAGRRRVEQEFSLEGMVANYEKVYLDLMHNSMRRVNSEW